MKWNSKKEAKGTTYTIEDNWGYCKNKKCNLHVPNLSKNGYCQMCERKYQNTLKAFI